MHIDNPEGATQANGSYLDRLMRRESFQALWPLFARAPKPAKEMTESFSALVHLRPHLPTRGPFRVLHVGDGAHARTAALFALKTSAENVSIDPVLNLPLVEGWRAEYQIRRLSFHKERIENVVDTLNSLPKMPVFVSFVHAHVDIDAALSRLDWVAAFSLVCCVPGHQTTRAYPVHAEGQDWSVLSADRRYQVLLNPGLSVGGVDSQS